MTTAYQMGRWYDAYPQLAFALSVLHWSPASLQQEAVDALEAMFVSGIGYDGVCEDDGAMLGHRWYDHADNGWRVAMLRHVPRRMKQQAAETLLHVLNQAGAA